MANDIAVPKALTGSYSPPLPFHRYQNHVSRWHWDAWDEADRWGWILDAVAEAKHCGAQNPRYRGRFLEGVGRYAINIEWETMP